LLFAINGEFAAASKPRVELLSRCEVVHAESNFVDVARMTLGTILLIILIVLLIGSLPTWGYSGGWGYYPSGGVGLLLVIIIILLALGRI
jgi:Protein of unknown function (DUF3309)